MADAPSRTASRDALRGSLEELHRLTSSRRGFSRRMATVGVTLTQPAAVVLGHVCRRGPLPMGDVARATRNDPGATARLVAALEADGLLQRSRSSDDRRVNLVGATPHGRAVAAQVDAAQVHHLDRALAALDDDELASCAATLYRLVRLLRDAPEVVAPDVVELPEQRSAAVQPAPG